MYQHIGELYMRLYMCSYHYRGSFGKFDVGRLSQSTITNDQFSNGSKKNHKIYLLKTWPQITSLENITMIPCVELQEDQSPRRV